MTQRLNPKVHIDERVFQKIMYWCNKANKFEVSGLGNVIYDAATNAFIVNEVYLLEQENTGTTTDINDAAIGKLMHEHFKSKIKGDLNFWWHSHADMNVFWSGTDMATIEQLGGNGWFLSTVFNKKEEMRSAYHASSPMTIFIDDLDTQVLQSFSDKDLEKALCKMGLQVRPGKLDEIRWLVEPFLSDKEQAAWDEEYTKKVKEKVFTYVPPTGVYSANRLMTQSGLISANPRNSFNGHHPLDPFYGDDDDSEMCTFPDEYGFNLAMSKEQSSVPDFKSERLKFGLSREDMEQLYEEVEEFIIASPGSSREDVILAFEADYPFIAEIIHPNFKGLAK